MFLQPTCVLAAAGFAFLGDAVHALRLVYG